MDVRDEVVVFSQWDLCHRPTKLSRVRQDDGLEHVEVKRWNHVIESLNPH
jgi:hypothetical protein